MRSTFGRFTSLAVVATTAVFVACDESPTSLDAQDSPAEVAQLSSNAGNPVVRSARGSGHHQGPNIGGIEVGWRVFTFNAIQRQDGTTTGNMKYDSHDQGDPAITHRATGRVFCMADLGDGMIVIGAEGASRTPYDTPPAFPGLPQANLPDDWGIFFVVRDNGEGASASGPDQFSGTVSTDIASVELLCRLGGNHPLAAIAESFLNDAEAGNIQVSW